MKFLGIPVGKTRIIQSPPLHNKITSSINLEDSERIKCKYNLPNKYLFYPAQFWYHKNHVKLIRAIELAKKRYEAEIALVLVGHKKNNFDRTVRTIKDLNLEKAVKWLGYVPEEDMPYLYSHATALIVPTLFESVSIPIWEAFYFGCPVLSSNVCALPEQIGEAGLLFNPNNVEDMAEKIYRIWNDEDLRQNLVKKGYERVKNMTLENYAKQWEHIIEEALARMPI